MRTSISVITPQESAAIVAKHSADHPDGFLIPLHTCLFPATIQEMMVEINKARKQAKTTSPSDDFDPSKVSRPDRQKQPASQMMCRPLQSDAKPAVNAPFRDELGPLLSPSKRPGGSKCQYGQKVKANGLFGAVITQRFASFFWTLSNRSSCCSACLPVLSIT